MKSVVCGLAQVGACDESALMAVFDTMPGSARAGAPFEDGANQFVRIVLRTDWIPCDPVAIREDFDPRSRQSAVGQAAASAMRRYYAESPRAPRLEPADDSAYDGMARDLRMTPHLTRGEGW